MAWKIPLFKIYSDKADLAAVTAMIKRGTYWAAGPEIEEFEKKIAAFAKSKYAIAFNSGTSALYALMLAHDIRGKEVIVPSFTFIATASAVLLAGGIPVFAEVEQNSFGLDAEDVKKKITNKTKAIVLVHYGGFPARDTEKIKAMCKQRNILLIEDAAESIGAHINGKQTGTFGISAIFSFCQNKVITTGEGGMIITNSDKVHEKAMLLRSHGRLEETGNYFSMLADNDYIEAGHNFRLPTMLAALGLAQFSKLKSIIEKRRRIASYYSLKLLKIPEITIMKELPFNYSVYQLFTIQLADEKTRDRLQQYLAEKGIMTKVYFQPVHLKTLYQKLGHKKGELPITEHLAATVLTLPLYPHLTRREADYVISSIQKYFKR